MKKSKDKLVKVLESMDGQRADQILSSLLGLSRNQVEKLFEAGHVFQEEKVLKKMTRLKGGDIILYHEIQKEAMPTSLGRPMALDVAYEDDDLLVINKAAGMVVHPAPGHSSGTLVQALTQRGYRLSNLNGEERPGILHRLDKESSGLLIVAKSNEAHLKLSIDLQARKIERIYQALAFGVSDESDWEVEANIGRDPKERKRMAVHAQGRYAKSYFKQIATYDWCQHLQIKLETGRTHQIRVHLKHSGYPVLGDALYGGRKGGIKRVAVMHQMEASRVLKAVHRTMLHAYSLKFNHPLSAEVIFIKSDIPEDMCSLLKLIKSKNEL